MRWSVVVVALCAMSSVANAGTILLRGQTDCCWPGLVDALDAASTGGLSYATSFSDLDRMLEHDSIFLLGSSVGSLTTSEVDNLATFIAAGRRVALLGEGSPVHATLNGQILGLVDGSSEGVDQHGTALPVFQHELTLGVGTVQFFAGDRAIGGTPLFDQNYATLWGNELNVLTILDASHWVHVDRPDINFVVNAWAMADNGRFGENVAGWLAADIQPVPLPPAAWMGLGLLAGLGLVRRLRRRP